MKNSKLAGKIKRNYIGLSTTPHDPAIAIINASGELVFAEAAERYLQNKRGLYAIPADLFRISDIIQKYCEPGAELVISTTWTNTYANPFLFLIKKNLYRLFKRETDIFSFPLFPRSIKFCNDQSEENINYRYQSINPQATVIRRNYSHHLTHAAASCYSSPYDEAVCVVVDGFGEFTTLGIFKFKKGNIDPVSDIPKSEISLGLFYAFLCDLCGFDFTKGEEWKVMGLAAYGSYNEKIYRLLRSLIEVRGCQIICPSNNRKLLQEKIIQELRVKSNVHYREYADLAFTGQYLFSETMTNLLNNVYKLNISHNLILSGGCALNSSYNGKILGCTPFKDLYVFSAPADDGNAVGTAFLSYYEDNPTRSYTPKVRLPYLGEELSNNALSNLQRYSQLQKLECSDAEISLKTAELLASGKLIGWVQGRAEFGPRALGNRSILADPRSEEVKDRLNTHVKFREEFRPFAPSILHEFGEEYFESYQESPYMERTLHFKKEAAKKVPGVVHVDGTGRLQTVKKEWNEKYYNLIYAFYKLTDVPIILNTSFNVMGKPIIHTIEDAIAVFFTSGLDVLIVGNFIYFKASH